MDIKVVTPSTPPSEWYKDQFFVSTNKSLVDPVAVNVAFGTESLYWAKPMDETLLKKMLNNSLCFGVYELPSSSANIAGRNNPRMIGLARLITDEVSFAYLTDVYIHADFQGRGLGSWLIGCVNETLKSWPALRRLVFVASGDTTFYQQNLDAKPFDQSAHGMVMMSAIGRGSVLYH